MIPGEGSVRNPRNSNTIAYSFRSVKREKWITDTKAVCGKILGKLGIKGWEVAVLFCDDTYMTVLNAEYRRKNAPTDVLAFRQDDDEQFPEMPGYPKAAGDVVISVDTLLRNAAEDGIDPKVELVRLLIHAILHLDGMDHDEENNEMIETQEKLLAELGYGSI